MVHAVVTARLEDVSEPNQVRVHVGLGVRQRIPDAGLSREVNDPGRPVPLEQVWHPVAVTDVQWLEHEPGEWRELGEARALEVWVVVLAEVVDADDSLAVREKSPGDVEANESGRSGDEDGH
jgi:hypothetical protein